ncbi:MAG: HAD-IA family hydrolase [Lachnospiraceae bacterium]|nr:HAD-IA family hydrolase [Lachnospiraceae bacterium]
MIRAVIFDMFETLVTLFEGRTYFSENMAEDIGADVTSFRKAWHESERDRSIGKMTMREGIADTLRKIGKYDEETVDRLFEKRLAALGDTFSAIPQDSVDLLKGLKERGIKVGLITNTFSDERDLVRASELFPFFDAAMISYEQGELKPDPVMYLRIMEEFGVKPDECLYVGDGGSRELYAARDLGMNTVQALWFHDRAFEPHVPCCELPEFPHAMKQAEIFDYI